jgi:hypothetical protein
MGSSLLILAGHLHHQHLSVISRTGVHFALARGIVGTARIGQPAPLSPARNANGQRPRSAEAKLPERRAKPGAR